MALTPDNMPGDEKRLLIRKVAIFMLSVEVDMAASIMRQLEDDEAEDIGIEIARLGHVPQEERDGVLEEFHNLIIAQGYAVQGGISLAKALLEKALPPERAKRALEAVEQTVQRGPFSFLRKMEAENLATFLQEEHPQTIALIMSYIPGNQAAQILNGLPAEKQIEVIRRVAQMEVSNPDVVRSIERTLERRLAGVMSGGEMQEVGGVPAVAEILNVVDRFTSKAVLDKLEEDDAELVDQIKRRMFVFEDLLLVNDRGIQVALREVDNAELSMALKSASEDLQNKILSNMSQRAAEMVREEMEYMGPVKLADVEAAQQNIVNIVRRLEEAGELFIEGRGESQMVG